MTLIHCNLVKVFWWQYQYLTMTISERAISDDLSTLSSTSCLFPAYSTSVKGDDLREWFSQTHWSPNDILWDLSIDIGYSKKMPDWLNVTSWLNSMQCEKKCGCGNVPRGRENVIKIASTTCYKSNKRFQKPGKRSLRQMIDSPL